MPEDLTFLMGNVPGSAAGRSALRPQPHVVPAGGRATPLRIHHLRRSACMQDVYFLDWWSGAATRGTVAADRPHETSKAVADLFAPMAAPSLAFNQELLNDRRPSTSTIMPPAGCLRWRGDAEGC